MADVTPSRLIPILTWPARIIPCEHGLGYWCERCAIRRASREFRWVDDCPRCHHVAAHPIARWIVNKKAKTVGAVRKCRVCAFEWSQQ